MNDMAAAIFAHPDDEVLCCGGALARHVRAGGKAQILILATGLAARGDISEDTLAQHRSAAEASARTLGAERIVFGDFPDNRMDSVARLDVVQTIERFLQEVRPSTVFTHHVGDINVDHGVVARAVLTATRPVGGCSVSRVLAGETISSTEWGLPVESFVPTTYINISDVLSVKVAALACYAHELRPFPHPRSPEAVEHLARLRGSAAGLSAAEAFYVLREIIS